MRRVFVVLFSVLALSFVLVTGSAKLRVHAKEKGSSKVVILRCTPAPPVYNVTAASSSTGSPTVTIGAACAQTLADEASAGFQIRDVELEPGTGSLVYTLVSGSGGGEND